MSEATYRCRYCKAPYHGEIAIAVHEADCKVSHWQERRRARARLRKPAQTQDELEQAGDPFAKLLSDGD